jgi:hypothetical protein
MEITTQNEAFAQQLQNLTEQKSKAIVDLLDLRNRINGILGDLGHKEPVNNPFNELKEFVADYIGNTYSDLWSSMEDSIEVETDINEYGGQIEINFTKDYDSRGFRDAVESYFDEMLNDYFEQLENGEEWNNDND